VNRGLKKADKFCHTVSQYKVEITPKESKQICHTELQALTYALIYNVLFLKNKVSHLDKNISPLPGTCFYDSTFTSGLNFINVLRAYFLYKILAPKITNLEFGCEGLAPKI